MIHSVQAIFEEAARDLGQPEFTNDLAVALHQVSHPSSYNLTACNVLFVCMPQFPGSDGLPYTGKIIAHVLYL